MIFGGRVRKMYKGNTVMKWSFREHPHFLGWVSFTESISSFNANIKLKWPKGTIQYCIKTLGILEMFASIPAMHPIDMVLKRLILYAWMTMYSYMCIYIYIWYVQIYLYTTTQHIIDTWPYITSTKKLIYIDHAYQLQGSQIGNPKPPHPKPQGGALLQDSLSYPVERNPGVSDTSPLKLVSCPELCWKYKIQVFVFSQRWNKQKTPKRNWVWNVAKIKNIAGWPTNLSLGLNKKCDSFFQKRPS